MSESNKLIDFYSNPILLFEKWFEEAKQKEINDPNAMNLATISKNLKISSRMVLLKSFDENNFIFYTNENSKKGKSIKYNSYVALNFYWKSLRRQIRIEGAATKISSKESDDYFNTRPMESKIGAWASKQSEYLQNRKDLENDITNYNNKFNENKITRPPHWVGYSVNPILIEFWQEMPFRLHDRIEYIKKEDEWVSKKLYP
tara:strand:+ start:32 stop:637 length:606 start_codon:yes stop_codon:yes gene_type:complete